MSRKRQVDVINRDHSKGRSHSRVSHKKKHSYREKAKHLGEPYVASSHVAHLIKRILRLHK